MNSELAQWVLIPLLIMVARITDVTIGTTRIIFVARGNARVAAILGFFEVTIWLLAISQVLQNLTMLSRVRLGLRAGERVRDNRREEAVFRDADHPHRHDQRAG